MGFPQMSTGFSSNSIKREVMIRLMTGYENVDNVIAFEYANQVIGLDKKDDWLLSKAYIIIARNEFENGNYAKSKSSFEKVIKLSAFDEGAEAKYYLAYLTYLDEDLVLAEQMKDYFQGKIAALTGNTENLSETQKNLLPEVYVNSKFFQSIFGSNIIELLSNIEI